MPVWKRSWRTAPDVSWKPEHRAVFVLYDLVETIIGETQFLADIASGEAWEGELNRRTKSQERLQLREEAIVALNNALGKRPVQSLDVGVFEPIRAAVAESRVLFEQGRVDELNTLSMRLLSVSLNLDRYWQYVLRHVFGEYGAYFFAHAHDFVRCLGHQFADSDVTVLKSVWSKPAFVIEANAEPLSANQRRILDVLDGRALKKMDLAREVYGDPGYGNILYRPNNLIELREKGLVSHKRGIGFYRPERPPPDTFPSE